MNFELLSIGDASLDTFITPKESESMCQLNDRESIICFTYGDKIPVKSLDFSIGGNAANNTLGTKRLGVNVIPILTLGSDNIADQIISKLKEEEIDVSFITKHPVATSNYSIIINYSGERTIFTFKSPVVYSLPDIIPSSAWIYLTSMGDDFEAVYGKIYSYLEVHPEVKLGFNPGSRQIREGVVQIKNILKHTQVLFVNREEAEKITGVTKSQGNEKRLMETLLLMGVKNPVITDGGNGSFVYDGHKYLKCGILPIDSFERTGAGDAFGSGCLSALIKGKSFEEALLWGTINSASVIGFIGSQKGLLKQEDISDWMERAKSSNVEVVEF